MTDLAVPLRSERRPRPGASGASREAVESLADTPVTGGKAADVLRGLRSLEEDLTAAGTIAPTKRTAAPAAPQPLWRKILSWLFNGAILGTALYFWPARFGGSTTAVLVRGTSMLPHYELNDVVFVRAQDEYEIGDIVLFEIPEGPAEGMQIIHRIIEKWPDGTWKTQGDNRPTADQFHLTDDRLVGTPVLHIPEAGRALQLLNNTYIIAGAVGVGAVMLMWPGQQAADESEADADAKPRRAAAAGPPADPDAPVDVMPTVAIIGAPIVRTVAPSAEEETGDPVVEFASVEDLLADLGLADAPVVETEDVPGAEGSVAHEPMDDVDAAAQRWLAEELAALGIDL